MAAECMRRVQLGIQRNSRGICNDLRGVCNSTEQHGHFNFAALHQCLDSAVHDSR
jgi:hypothetical protein